MYLNVDEDAASTLERKRNYIYCLIVHILKQEKEMHIDNLVFKVRTWSLVGACPSALQLTKMLWSPCRSSTHVRNGTHLAPRVWAISAAPPVTFCRASCMSSVGAALDGTRRTPTLWSSCPKTRPLPRKDKRTSCSVVPLSGRIHLTARSTSGVSVTSDLLFHLFSLQRFSSSSSPS